MPSTYTEAANPKYLAIELLRAVDFCHTDGSLGLLKEFMKPGGELERFTSSLDSTKAVNWPTINVDPTNPTLLAGRLKESLLRTIASYEDKHDRVPKKWSKKRKRRNENLLKAVRQMPIPNVTKGHTDITINYFAL